MQCAGRSLLATLSAVAGELVLLREGREGLVSSSIALKPDRISSPDENKWLDPLFCKPSSLLYDSKIKGSGFKKRSKNALASLMEERRGNEGFRFR